MTEPLVSVIYWDSSAVLSVLFKDAHSTAAAKWAARGDVHLLSSLAHAEIWAVVSRMKREGFLPEAGVEDVRVRLEGGPWRYLSIAPDRKMVVPLAMKWSLRGADLWHLAAAKSLQTRLPEIYLLTFDKTLEVAARGEGLTLSRRKN